MTDDEDMPHPEILRVELLPCPFCGAHPEIDSWTSREGEIEWQIDCENPECGLVVSSNVRDSFEEAARAWNNRLI